MPRELKPHVKKLRNGQTWIIQAAGANLDQSHEGKNQTDIQAWHIAQQSIGNKVGYLNCQNHRYGWDTRVLSGMIKSRF